MSKIFPLLNECLKKNKTKLVLCHNFVGAYVIITVLADLFEMLILNWFVKQLSSYETFLKEIAINSHLTAFDFCNYSVFK